MSADSRKELEKRLLVALKTITSSCVSLKPSKNKISLLVENERLGEIYIQHLSKADGYYAGLEVYRCEALDFCLSQSPPYASRLMNSSFLSKTSLSEDGKQFGDEIGGTIRTPVTAEIDSTAQKIRERLVRFYLPEAEDAVTGSLSMINNILAEPDNYAFPFLSALFCAKQNNLALNSDVFQTVLENKKLFGNKKFDSALAERILG